MPDRSDRGGPKDRAQRFPAEFRISVACREWSQVEKLATANASRTGLFIRAQKAPRVGAHLTLELELPDGNRLDLVGTVVHVVSLDMARARGIPAGFGVKLLTEHDPDLVLLESMAHAEAQVPARPGRPPSTAPTARLRRPTSPP